MQYNKFLPELDCGDSRINKRAKSVIDSITLSPNKTIPHAMGNWADTKGCYRLLSSDKLTTKSLIKSNLNITCKNLLNIPDNSLILASNDTCELNFNNLESASDELGYISDNRSKGLILHNLLFTQTDGVPVGVPNQQIFVRKKGSKQKSNTKNKTKKIEDKESYKWIQSVKTINKIKDREELKDKNLTYLVVADRESDIYQIFDESLKHKNIELLIRSYHNREFKEVSDGNKKDKINRINSIENSNKKLIDTITIKLSKKRPNGVDEIKAKVYFKKLLLQKPKSLKKDNNIKDEIQVNYIEVIEIAKSNSSQLKDYDKNYKIQWKLITTLDIKTDKQQVLKSKNLKLNVLKIVDYYTKRWIIERFHYILKSGCNIEKLKLRELSRIEKAIHLYSISAIQILYLTYSKRVYTQTKIKDVIPIDDWKLLYLLVTQRTKKHKIQNIKKIPKNILEATVDKYILYLAILGGYLNRKHDKQPGLKVIWRGLKDFDIARNTRTALKTGLMGN